MVTVWSTGGEGSVRMLFQWWDGLDQGSSVEEEDAGSVYESEMKRAT